MLNIFWVINRKTRPWEKLQLKEQLETTKQKTLECLIAIAHITAHECLPIEYVYSPKCDYMDYDGDAVNVPEEVTKDTANSILTDLHCDFYIKER